MANNLDLSRQKERRWLSWAARSGVLVTDVDKDLHQFKVSGGLLQIVSHEFSGNTLTMRFKGRTLEDVQAVQVSTFVFDRGSCQDLLYSDGYDD